MSDIKTILKTITDAVDKLSNAASVRQNPLYNEIVNLLTKLQTRDGALLNNVKNLETINTIKNKVERLIIDSRYKEQLKEFAGAYTELSNLHNEYFSKFTEKFKPTNTLEILRKSAIETTITNLTEVGIEAGVTDGIKKILLTNIQNGGSMATLTEQLRNHMLTNNTGEGALERYVRAYATTAINQYSAEYNKSIADDLGLEWYLYTGSLLTTSREFCIEAVAKKYIHQSEFEALLRGDFGNTKIHVNKKTGVPDGLMDGTTPDNFPRRRGGWNCGHQLIAVDDSIVPKNIQDEVYATTAYQAWALKNSKQIKGKPVEVIKGLSIDSAKEVMKTHPISEMQKKAITSYTGGDYNSINGYLRGIKKTIAESHNETIDTLDKFLTNAPKVTATTYRGINLNEYNVKEFIAKLQKGALFNDKGFISTSYDKVKALEFGTSQRVKTLVTIEGRSGVLVEQHSNIKSEKEVLFNKGTPMIVKDFKIKTDKKGIFTEISVTLSE